MYSLKEIVKATMVFLAMMSFLAGFLIINGLHYAGVL